MAGFALAVDPLTNAAATFSDLSSRLTGLDLDGMGNTVDTALEMFASMSTSLSTAASIATTTSTACTSQEGADGALQANDPTPAVIEQKKEAYLKNPTAEKADELKRLVQQRRDAIAAHEQATEGTEFPTLDDLPDTEGTGAPGGDTDDGDGPITPGEDTDEDGTRGSDGSLPSDSGDDKPPVDGTDSPTPSSTAPSPAATSPTPAPSPTTTIADTDAGTGLSGDTATLTGPTSAVASPTAAGQMGGAQPQQGGQGAFTAPASGTMLNPNAPAPTRAQQRQQQEERKENAARAAESGVLSGIAALPGSIENAQSTQVPGTPSTPTSLASNDSRLGQVPPNVTQGHSTPPAGSAGGPSQTSGMPLGSGMSGMARNNAMGGSSTPAPKPVEAPANPFEFLDEPSYAEQYAPPPPPSVPPPAPAEPTSTFDADEERRAAAERELKRRGFFDSK